MNWTARNKIAGSHVLYSSVPYPVYKKEDIIQSIINLFKKEAKIPKEDLASDTTRLILLVLLMMMVNNTTKQNANQVPAERRSITPDLKYRIKNKLNSEHLLKEFNETTKICIAR